MSSIFTRMSKDDFFRMGYLYQMSGDLYSAAKCYIRSIESGPSAEAHTFLGWVLSQMGEIEAAITECQKALKLNPGFGNALNDMGAYMMERQQYDEAIPYLMKAAKAKNYDSPAYPHYNLARIYTQKGMMLRALQHLQKALKANPGFLPAKNLLEKLENQIH